MTLVVTCLSCYVVKTSAVRTTVVFFVFVPVTIVIIFVVIGIFLRFSPVIKSVLW